MKNVLIIFSSILLLFPSCSKKMKNVYYGNGTIKLTYYENGNGQKDGEYIEYYKSGDMKFKTKYVNNLINDTAFWYFENGKLKSLKIFKNGIENGTAFENNREGHIIKSAIYTKGVSDIVKEYVNDSVINEYRRFYIEHSPNILNLGQKYELKLSLFDSNNIDRPTFFYKQPKLINKGKIVFDKGYQVIDNEGKSAKFIFSPEKEGKYGFIIGVYFIKNNIIEHYECKKDFEIRKCNKDTLHSMLTLENFLVKAKYFVVDR